MMKLMNAALALLVTAPLTLPATGQSLTPVLPISGQPLLNTPVFVTSWPGNPDLLVVVERGTGMITCHSLSGSCPSATVVDLSSEAYIPVSWGDFAGVTGAAFHPEFLTDPKKRHLYVRFNYGISVGQPLVGDMVIRRYYIPPGTGTGNVFATNPFPPPQDVYTYPMTATAHTAGEIMFDARPGNYDRLYVAMPDDVDQGSGDCCAMDNAQDPNFDLGKLLEIDVSDLSPNPTFPVTQLARGLRNPFYFSVDRGDPNTGSGQGRILIGDVGDQATCSVVLFDPVLSPTTTNYGWPWEIGDASLLWGAGPLTTDGPCATDMNCPEIGSPSYTTPVVVFSDAAEFPPGGWSALIGGYVARTSSASMLNGKYIFAIWGGGPMVSGPRLYETDAAFPNGTASSQILASALASWGSNERIHGMGEDSNGDLYVIRVDQTGLPPGANGTVFKIQ